jgi:hypothetical protein
MSPYQRRSWVGSDPRLQGFEWPGCAHGCHSVESASFPKADTGGSLAIKPKAADRTAWRLPPAPALPSRRAEVSVLRDTGFTASRIHPSSLMWTAPEVASAICSGRGCCVTPPMGAVSPVRNPLAARPPEALRHNRAAPAQHRALPPSRCLRGWRAGCPATPETGPASPPASALHRVSPGRRYRTTSGGFVGASAAVALRRAL